MAILHVYTSSLSSTSPTPATPAHLCPLLLACSHQVRTSLVLQHVLPSLNEEAQVVAVVLGFLDQHTSHVSRRPGVYTELRDDLGVQRDPLAPKLVEALLAQNCLRRVHGGEKIPNFAI